MRISQIHPGRDRGGRQRSRARKGSPTFLSGTFLDISIYVVDQGETDFGSIIGLAAAAAAAASPRSELQIVSGDDGIKRE